MCCACAEVLSVSLVCTFLHISSAAWSIISYSVLQHVVMWQFEARLCETADFLTARNLVWEVRWSSCLLSLLNICYNDSKCGTGCVCVCVDVREKKKNVCTISKKRWRVCVCARKWKKEKTVICRHAFIKEKCECGGLCVCVCAFPHICYRHPPFFFLFLLPAARRTLQPVLGD